jgi:site-specific DNA-cytosine methylase
MIHVAQDDGYVELPSGLIVPESLVKKRPKAVDLFCGCGGASCGFIAAGFEVVAALDYAPDAALTYLVNLGAYPVQFHWIEPSDQERMEKILQRDFLNDPRNGKRKSKIKQPLISGSGWIKNQGVPGCGHFFLGDIRKISGRQILDAIGMKQGELECVMGSPPCQGYSRAGKQNVMDPRNSLVFEFARLVIELRPKSMIFENVPHIAKMVTPDGMPVMDTFIRILEDGGFGTVDALRKSLLSQAGSAGLMRGRPPAKTKTEKTPAKRQAQKSFDFGVATAS